MAISSGDIGSLGIIRDKEVYWYEASIKLHTLDSKFEVRNFTKLPKVSIVYFYIDAAPDILRYVAEHWEGIVIAGAGEFSKQYIDVIYKLTIPVVISSKIDNGLIT